MNFVGFVDRHSRSILVVMFALAAAGVFAAVSLPVGLFPQISFPRVRISIDAGDRPADQMDRIRVFARQRLRLGSENGAGHKAGAEEPHDCAM